MRQMVEKEVPFHICRPASAQISYTFISLLFFRYANVPTDMSELRNIQVICDDLQDMGNLQHFPCRTFVCGSSLRSWAQVALDSTSACISQGLPAPA